MKKFQVASWRFSISTLLLLYFYEKRLIWAYFNQKMDFFQVFRGQMKILMAVLESASKMRWTIREGFSIWWFFKKKFFFLEISTIFPLQNPKKKIFSKKFIFKNFLADGSSHFWRWFQNRHQNIHLTSKNLKKVHFLVEIGPN